MFTEMGQIHRLTEVHSSCSTGPGQQGILWLGGILDGRVKLLKV